MKIAYNEIYCLQHSEAYVDKRDFMQLFNIDEVYLTRTSLMTLYLLIILHKIRRLHTRISCTLDILS